MNDSDADQGDRRGWWQRLSGGLKRTSASLGAAISDLVSKRKLDDAMIEEIDQMKAMEEEAKRQEEEAKRQEEIEKKAAAEAVQTYAMQVVTHVPLGEWFAVGAARDNIVIPSVLPPVTVFWGIEKK